MAFKYPVARRDDSKVSVKVLRCAFFSPFFSWSVCHSTKCCGVSPRAGKAIPGRENARMRGGTERQMANGRGSKNKTLLCVKSEK